MNNAFILQLFVSIRKYLRWWGWCRSKNFTCFGVSCKIRKRLKMNFHCSHNLPSKHASLEISKTGWWGGQGMKFGTWETHKIKAVQVRGSSRTPNSIPIQILSKSGVSIVGGIHPSVESGGNGTSLEHVSLLPATHCSPTTNILPSPHVWTTPLNNCYRNEIVNTLVILCFLSNNEDYLACNILMT